MYCIWVTYANSADPDQTPQHAASDQGLHYLNRTDGYFSLEVGSCPNDDNSVHFLSFSV